MEDEIWKPVAGYESCYEVSSLARVRRLPSRSIKRPTLGAGGYLVVGLWQNNKGRVVHIHDLVAEAFIGPKPRTMSVNHKSGDKLVNLPTNLEYLSLADNTRHQHAMGLTKVQGEDNHAAKLTTPQVLEIRARCAAGERTCDLAREFGVKPPIVSQIKHRTRWRHLA